MSFITKKVTIMFLIPLIPLAVELGVETAALIEGGAAVAAVAEGGAVAAEGAVLEAEAVGAEGMIAEEGEIMGAESGGVTKAVGGAGRFTKAFGAASAFEAGKSILHDAEKGFSTVKNVYEKGKDFIEGGKKHYDTAKGHYDTAKGHYDKAKGMYEQGKQHYQKAKDTVQQVRGGVEQLHSKFTQGAEAVKNQMKGHKAQVYHHGREIHQAATDAAVGGFDTVTNSIIQSQPFQQARNVWNSEGVQGLVSHMPVSGDYDNLDKYVSPTQLFQPFISSNNTGRVGSTHFTDNFGVMMSEAQAYEQEQFNLMMSEANAYETEHRNEGYGNYGRFPSQTTYGPQRSMSSIFGEQLRMHPYGGGRNASLGRMEDTLQAHRDMQNSLTNGSRFDHGMSSLPPSNIPYTTNHVGNPLVDPSFPSTSYGEPMPAYPLSIGTAPSSAEMFNGPVGLTSFGGNQHGASNPIHSGWSSRNLLMM